MKSTADQQLFKSLSNRTRAKPEEIYSKLSAHLSQLQEQITYFNKFQEVVGQNINRQIKRPTSRQFRLKTMTQPKYQNLLLNFELQKGGQAQKDNKLNRKFSNKSGKDFKNFAMGSSMTSFIGFKSNTQSKIAQSRGTSGLGSKMKNKTELKSTLIHTGAQPDSFLLQSHPSNDINLGMTQSIVFQDKKQNLIVKSRKLPKSLKELITEKQKILDTEWNKTQRYKSKVSSCVGQQDYFKLQQSALGKTRIAHVISKVCKSRPTTAQSQHLNSHSITID